MPTHWRRRFARDAFSSPASHIRTFASASQFRRRRSNRALNYLNYCICPLPIYTFLLNSAKILAQKQEEAVQVALKQGREPYHF